MLRVILCSTRDLRPELAATLIGRQGIEVYRVVKFADVRLVGSSLGVQVILVDSEFPDAAGFIRRLREEPATRERSVAVLSRGSMQEADLGLLEAGANAIFRLPPDAGWDERFSKLLMVPVRQHARMVAHIEVATEPLAPAAILNLSSGGMFVVTHRALRVSDEFKFRFTLPGKTAIVGRGRVTREVPGTGFGVEFIELDGEGKDAVLAFLRSARLG
jgi:CheY-like chemotaxis protein